MPRNRTHTSFPSTYMDMLDAFNTTATPLHHTLPTRAHAYRQRNEWFAFLKALERDAQLARRTGDMASYHRLNALHTTGRSRKVMVDPPLQSSTSMAHPNAPHTITWVARDHEPENASLRTALQEQLGFSRAPAPAPHTPPHDEPPSTGPDLDHLLDDFFPDDS